MFERIELEMVHDDNVPVTRMKGREREREWIDVSPRIAFPLVIEMMMNGITNKLSFFREDVELVEVRDEFAMLSDDESLSRRKSESNKDGEDDGM